MKLIFRVLERNINSSRPVPPPTINLYKEKLAWSREVVVQYEWETVSTFDSAGFFN